MRLRRCCTLYIVGGAPPRRFINKKCQATSNKANGFLWAIKSNVRAAPDGARRPCSQSCSVRTDTPNKEANRDCESSVILRISTTGGTFSTRPVLPCFRSRIPCNISDPMSLSSLNLLFPHEFALTHAQESSQLCSLDKS